MRLITEIDNFPQLHGATGLTIGNFDGVHRGHLSLLHHLRSLLPKDGSLIVYTFLNHPRNVLTHAPAIPAIYTLEHKLKTLAENGVDYLILTTFTKQFAATPFDQFLKKLKSKTGFSRLVLGEGASFGKNKEGNQESIQALAQQLHFKVDYVPKSQKEQEVISSARIRTLIAEGKFQEITDYLGRPYSIYATVHPENNHLLMPLAELCLPPEGNYPVRVKIADSVHLGRAHVDRRGEQLRIDLTPPLPLSQPVLAEIVF